MAGAEATGPVAVAVSNRAVELVRRYTGRGPTEARTTIDRDHVLVVMTAARRWVRLADAGVVLGSRVRALRG
jgi:hypothetical protein